MGFLREHALVRSERDGKRRVYGLYDEAVRDSWPRPCVTSRSAVPVSGPPGPRLRATPAEAVDAVSRSSPRRSG